MGTRKKIPYGSKVPLKLTLRERDIIRDHTFCNLEIFNLALVEGNGILVDVTLDDIEDILGFTAAASNHGKDKNLIEELDRLFMKLERYLDRYDDQE